MDGRIDAPGLRVTYDELHLPTGLLFLTFRRRTRGWISKSSGAGRQHLCIGITMRYFSPFLTRFVEWR